MIGDILRFAAVADSPRVSRQQRQQRQRKPTLFRWMLLSEVLLFGILLRAAASLPMSSTDLNSYCDLDVSPCASFSSARETHSSCDRVVDLISREVYICTLWVQLVDLISRDVSSGRPHFEGSVYLYFVSSVLQEQRRFTPYHVLAYTVNTLTAPKTFPKTVLWP